MPDIPDAMLAAIYKGDRNIVVEEMPVPPVGPDQVLLQVSHCGVCGTDVHTLYDNWGSAGSVAGHEYSGVVMATGSQVDDWRPGDRVVGGPRRGCGRCRHCGNGRSNLCADRPRAGLDPFVGAFAAFKVVDAACLYRIPDRLNLRTAALTEPLAVVLHGIGKGSPAPGDRVLVTGAGPIGLLHVAVLRDRGVSDIVVSAPAPRRKDAARHVGASAVIDPDDLVQPLWPMEVVAEPFRVAFECSGNREAMENALANLDAGGTLVLSGTGMRRPRFDPNRIILNELEVTGTMEYTPEDYAAALDLLASGRLPTDELIEPEDQPLRRLQWVLAQLSRGEITGKVMMVPDA